MKKFLSVVLIMCISVSLLSERVFACRNVTIGDFSVEADSGIVYDLADKTLRVTEPGQYMISNVRPEVATEDKIEISCEAEENVDLILVDVNIDVSDTVNAAAVNVVGDCHTVLSFYGTCTLKSGENCAGLQKDGNGWLEIESDSGDSCLTAIGGYHAAGIGGGDHRSVENISISGGKIIARGGAVKKVPRKDADGSPLISVDGKLLISTWYPECTAGAGIGGGNCGSAKSICICGSAVVCARGGHWGAAIGGGREGNAGEILITGDAVVEAEGGFRAPGIGAGRGGTLEGPIEFNGNANVKSIGKGDCAPGIGFGEGGSATSDGVLKVLNKAQFMAEGAPIRVDKSGNMDLKTGGVWVSCKIEGETMLTS